MDEDTKQLILDGRNGITACISSTKYENVEIKGCNKCFIYVMKAMEAVHIRHSTDCTVFICQASVTSVSFCNSVVVTAYTGKIEVSKSQEIDLYLYTSTAPIIREGSFKIRLAPYNAAVKSIVPTKANLWNRPNVQSGASYAILDPSDFLPMAVPFGEEPEGICAQLPLAYRKALAWREQVAEERRQLVLEFCKKVPCCAASIQERISSAFKQHLATTRNGEQLRQLQSAEYL